MTKIIPPRKADDLPTETTSPATPLTEELEELNAPTGGQLAASDVKRHAGALGGAAVGAVAGSFIPIIGTVGGAIVGAVVGHLNDRRRK
jgi:hypothetical protein